MEELNRIIKEYKERKSLVGISVSVTDREKTLYSKGFGYNDIENKIPATGDSVYRIASVTKMFTGITVLRLCEEGVLALDTPIKEYLPYLTLKSKEAEESITMRHLLTHTSGLPGEYTPDGPSDEGLLKESLTSALPNLDLVSLPWEKRYLYSNWGIRLASLVITELTSKPYSRLCQELVIDPLGLKSTAFDRGFAKKERISLPHVTDVSGSSHTQRVIKENATRLATGGLYSTVFDLAIFGRMLLRGGISDSGERIISEESLEAMRRRVSTAKTGNGYGITTIIYPHNGGLLYGHTGNAAPYNGIFLYDPQHNISTAVQINSKNENVQELAKKVLDTVKAIKNET